MRSASFLLFVILVFPNWVAANTQDAPIRLTRKSIIEVTPGATTNIALMFVNPGTDTAEYYIKITCPEYWNPVSDSVFVMVAPGESELKILSFYIPESTKSSLFSITFEALERIGLKSLGEVTAKVQVKPKYEVHVQTRVAPKYVFSGEKARADFLIQNLSNTKVTINLETVTINQIDHQSFSIEADSSRIVTLTAGTASGITQNIRNSISITAVVAEDPEVKGYSSAIFDVLPFNAEKFDGYNRIPVRISTLVMYNSQFADNNIGAIYNISGGGLISKRKKSTTEFQLRGPNRQGNPILGSTDMYYLKLNTPRSRFVIGDNVYALTQLTEGARGGRGIEYEYKGRVASLGAFYDIPRFYPELKEVYAAYAGLYPVKQFRINGGLLNKSYVIGPPAVLGTVSGYIRPLRNMNLDYEYAGGLRFNRYSEAYSFNFDANSKKSRIFVNYAYADKKFPGYISNTSYIASGANTYIGKKLSVSANYNMSNFHIALDTMFANAPFNTNLNLSLGYAFNYNTTISLGSYYTSREDMHVPAQFNYTENTMRLTIQHKLDRFDFMLYGSYGIMNNRINPQIGELNNVANGEFAVDYKMSRHLFIRGFVNYVGTQQYLVTDYTLIFYGGVASLNFNNLNMELEYQNNYEIEEYYRNRNLVSMKTNYTINNRHEIGLGLNYYNQKSFVNRVQTVATLNYTYLLKMPVNKRDDVGSIRGRVVNKGVESVEGIVFSIDGNIAITDKEGYFEFTAVTAGQHTLFIDNSRTGLNTITEEPGPFNIEVTAGEKLAYSIGLTKSGTISGKINLQEDVNKNDKSYIPLADDLPALIIEASNEKEIFRLFTNPDRTFSFMDMRPGKWKVKIYERGIPKGYKLEHDEFSIELAPDKTEFVDVQIKKASRKIQFQKSK